MNTIPISEMIENFLQEADIIPKSRVTYRFWLKPFTIYMVNQGLTLETITKPNLLDYKTFLIAKYSEKTVNCYLTAVKMFYRWLSDVNYSHNIAAKIKLITIRNPYRKKPLTKEQSIALISTTTNPRDKAIISIMIENGLRACEVSSLEWDDFNINDYTIRIRRKGHRSKDVTITLSDNLYRLLHKQYQYPSKYVFTSVMGKKLTPQRVSDIVNQQLRKANITDKEITGHSLRHTAAINMMNITNNDIIKVSRFMGHSDIKTTQIYIEHLRKDETGNRDIINRISNNLTEAIRQSEKGNKHDTNTGSSRISN